MTRREAVAAGVGAIGSAAVLLLLNNLFPSSRPAHPVVHQSQPSEPVDVPDGQDSCTAANSRLAGELTGCEHRLATRETELTAVKTTLASLAPDASTRDLANPYNSTTQEDWKYLASFGVVRAKNFSSTWTGNRATSSSGSWGWLRTKGPPSPSSRRCGQAHVAGPPEPACAKLVGTEEAARLGNDECWSSILYSYTSSQWDVDAQLWPTSARARCRCRADDLDALATRFLAMTSAVSDLEKDLSETFGPERAHEIAAADDVPWGGARRRFGKGARTGRLPMPQ